jgi:exopolyphosphatase/guanosine-5'-triphosphate,3'-diphosphate pyrophosphatase
MNTESPDIPLNATYAAIDLGSNSFHMVVGRMDEDRLVLVDRLREPVRLGEGLQADKSLDPAVAQRALDCLERFGQRLRGIPSEAIRAVGTNTMRRIDDGGAFLNAAEQALGHPIEIISGNEEARLVYLGVAHGLATGNETRLVIDIGGGSTELILGRGMEPGQRDSLYMGCVSMSQLMFSGGRITEDAMNSAMLRAALEVRPVRQLYSAGHWERAVGSSGTIRSIREVVKANGWSEEGITAASLKKLRKKLLKAGHVDKIDLEGLSDDRRPVFPGGVAVLSTLFESLGIQKMQVSDMALREGLLYELIGYSRHEDIRGRTVQSVATRFGVDSEQAQRVEMTAMSLLSQVARNWNLTSNEHARMLGWACQLHEVGLSISHSGFHKHGAYILANADMPGFSRPQQAMLASLVYNHRRKLSDSAFRSLPAYLQEPTRLLSVLLRLSVLLHRGRSPDSKPMLYLDVDQDKSRIQVSFPDAWLDDHPLTRAELEQEADYLSNAGFKLKF